MLGTLKLSRTARYVAAALAALAANDAQYEAVVTQVGYYPVNASLECEGKNFNVSVKIATEAETIPADASHTEYPTLNGTPGFMDFSELFLKAYESNHGATQLYVTGNGHVIRLEVTPL